MTINSQYLVQTLSGGDLRSIGRSNLVVKKIKDQTGFGLLFECLFHSDRVVVMRAVDAIEKISRHNESYLSRYKDKIFVLCESPVEKEMKWHLALLVSRLSINERELVKTWNILIKWARDRSNSRIVRVNSIQALFDLSQTNSRYKSKLRSLFLEIEGEQIPSLNARLRKLKLA